MLGHCDNDKGWSLWRTFRIGVHFLPLNQLSALRWNSVCAYGLSGMSLACNLREGGLFPAPGGAAS
jgi:hypothetical protein